jgi:hypothetical protein
LDFKLAKHTPVIVASEDSTKYMMIAFDRNSQYAFLLDENLQIEKSFVNEIQEEDTKDAKNAKDKKKKDIWVDDNADIVRNFMKTYTEPLGNFSRGNKAIVIYSNSDKTEFGSLMVDFEANKFVVTAYPIILEADRFVEGFMYQGNFCIMTAGKKLDFMKFYVISDYNKIDKAKEIQYGNQYVDLRDLLFKRADGLFAGKISNTPVIDYQTYNELGVTQAVAKIYPSTENVYITLDQSHKQTDMLILDIANEKLTVKTYPKTKIAGDNWSPKSNSYLYYNYLVQSVVSSDKLVIDFIDIRTSEKVNSYQVLREDSIQFKNTPLIQEKSGGFSEATRVLKKTSQLLNKITNSQVAIAINPSKDGAVKMILGSYLERKAGGGGGGGMMMYGGGMPVAPIFIPTPMYGGYNAGKLVKSAYFESSFSFPNFQHQQGQINATDNVMDVIRDYENKLEEANTVTLTNIFRRKNDFIFCYYLKTSDIYHLVAFPISR